MDGGREPGTDGANEGDGSDLGTWVQGLLEIRTHTALGSYGRARPRGIAPP